MYTISWLNLFLEGYFCAISLYFPNADKDRNQGDKDGGSGSVGVVCRVHVNKVHVSTHISSKLTNCE